MKIIQYPNHFFENNKKIYAKYTKEKEWGLYASQQFYPGDIVLKLYITKGMESVLQPGPTFGVGKDHGVSIAPHTEWCPTEKHPFWYFNHSCNSNCGFTQWGSIVNDEYVPVIAYTPILAHTHLTIDYSLITTVGEGTPDGEPWTMTNCFCGEPNCRKIISDWLSLSVSARQEHLAHQKGTVRYGDVIAHILHEDPESVAWLKIHYLQSYKDYSKAYVKQLHFSQAFLNNGIIE